MTNTDATGRSATSPWAMPWAGWRQVFLRTWNEAGDDNVGLVAAGVAFYGFLALVPLLGAVVLTYGLVAEPKTVIDQMRSLTQVMPADAARLIGEQLMGVVKASDGKKGLGLLVALGIALFGARNGASAIITALNIAYEEREKRNFLIVNLLALAITAVAVIIAIVALIAIAALGHLEQLFPGAPDVVLVAGKLLSYLLLVLTAAAGTATLYRFAPSRQAARWMWLSPGSILVAVLWLALTLGFGIYVADFGNYNATYGSLGAVVVLLTWLYLSSYILLFGAELNAELEHQTAHDTTSGTAEPIGARGAWVADHVASGSKDHKGDPDAPPSDAPTARGDGTEARGAAPSNNAVAAPLLASRGLSRLVSAGGGERVSLAQSVLATVGLSLLRRRGRGAAGLALVSAAACSAWLTREDRDTEI